MSTAHDMSHDMPPLAAVELAELLAGKCQELRERIADRAERRGLGKRTHHQPDWDDRYQLGRLQEAALYLGATFAEQAAASQELHDAGAPGDYRAQAAVLRVAAGTLQEEAGRPDPEHLPLRTYRAASLAAYQEAARLEEEAHRCGRPGWGSVATAWATCAGHARRADDMTMAEEAEERRNAALQNPPQKTAEEAAA